MLAPKPVTEGQILHDSTSVSKIGKLIEERGKEMATHSSVLTWRILCTEEPGGLPSMGSHRAGYD